MPCTRLLHTFIFVLIINLYQTNYRIMKLFLSILATFILSSAFCQDKLATISGKVVDKSSKPIPAVTITLVRSNDNVITKTGITNADGMFEMAGVKPGNYTIKTSSIGFADLSSKAFDIANDENYVSPDLTISAKTTQLSGVSIEAKKPMIEVRADKTIFNIEGSINATGSNAFELLQKSPGVMTDKDDNISMKGKNGVAVYIDGRPAQMAGKDLADFLRAVNSADIESIELISNPSAKYEASGNAGIINIKLKKNKKLGTNGSVSTGLSVGKSAKVNNSFSLNYRDKKFNLYSNYSNNFGKNQNSFNLYRIQSDSIYDQHNEPINKSSVHNFKVGADYFLDNKNTIGLMVTGNFNNSPSILNGSTIISPKSTNVPYRILFASNDQPSNKINMNYNANYHFSDVDGTSLDLDGNIGTFRGRTSSYQPNYYRRPVLLDLLSQSIISISTPSDININTFKVDYEKPVKKGKIGFGGKYSNVNTRNTFDDYDMIQGYKVFNDSLSNKFDYTEIVNALYVNYNRALSDKFNLQVGVRMENTNSEGKLSSLQAQTDADVKRDYTDFFPSGALTYSVNKKNSLNLTYSRRIDRPSYQDLNPFETRLDELTYQKGNAFLRPQYTNIVELTHTFMSRFNTTLGYSHIKDFRAPIIDTAGKNKSFRTTKNLASQDLLNLSISAPLAPFKWWNIFMVFNGYHSQYHADFGQGKVIDLGVTAYSAFLQQTFSLKEGLSIEVSGFFNSPNLYGGTFKTKAMGGVDLGIQKPIFNGKGNFKIGLTDIFNTLHFSGQSDFGGTAINVSARWESQQLRATMSYRFGNNQVKAARQRKLSSEEESKRLNGEGGIGGQ